MSGPTSTFKTPLFPLIVDVARCSFHDGPGIRSVVFFKGCRLQCPLCHNPETQKPWPEIAFFRNKCIECHSCIEACPHHALNFDLDHPIIKQKCNNCGKCSDVCPSGALHLFGRYYSVETLTELLAKDLSFYQSSGGGVTLSGGECALYPHYLNKLMKRLEQLGIHIIIETSGYFDYEKFENLVLPYVDMIYFDIKFADPALHELYCGKTNNRILDNLVKLIAKIPSIIQPRFPIFPGINDTDQNLNEVRLLLDKLGQKRIEVLPYNPTGTYKYEALGRPAPKAPNEFTSAVELSRIQKYLSQDAK